MIDDIRYKFLKSEYLTLSEKVDYLMNALVDLKAAEVALRSVVTHAVSTVSTLADRLSALDTAEAEIASIVQGLKDLETTLVATFGHPADVAPTAPVVDTPAPAAPEPAPAPVPPPAYTAPPINTNTAAM